MFASSNSSYRFFAALFFLSLIDGRMAIATEDNSLKNVLQGGIHVECPQRFSPALPPPASTPPPAKAPLPPPTYCYGFVASLAYQYLQVAQQGLDPIVVTTFTPGFSGTSTEMLMFKPLWRSAVDFTLGVVTPSGWNVHFDYFLLPNQNNALKVIPNTANFNNFSWQWNSVFHRFTLLIAKDCLSTANAPLAQESESSAARGGASSSGRCLSTIAFAGFTYAFEAQIFNYLSVTENSSVMTTTERTEVKQKWSAFGPYSGVELLLPLPNVNCLSFILLSGMGVLPSNARAQRNLDTTTDSSGALSVQQVHSSNSFPKISTMFHFVLGMRLCTASFYLQIAWTGETWPNHLQLFAYDQDFNPVGPPLPQANYTTSGVSVTGGFTW